MFLGCDTEFVVEGVMPDLLHIVPVGDNSVFDGVFQCQDTSLALGFVSYVRVFLSHTDHDTLVTGSTNNRGEDGPGVKKERKLNYNILGSEVAAVFIKYQSN